MTQEFKQEDYKEYEDFLSNLFNDNQRAVVLEDVVSSGLTQEILKKAGVKAWKPVVPKDIEQRLHKSRKAANELMGRIFIEYPYPGGYSRHKPFPQVDLPKYLQPYGVQSSPYFLKDCWEVRNKAHEPIVITEGEKKTLALAQLGENAIGLPGVWGFRRQATGYQTPVVDQDNTFSEILGQFCWRGRPVWIAFDSDLLEKENVLMALYELAFRLTDYGADVRIMLWEGEYKGIDDYLVAQTDRIEAVRELKQKAPVLKRFMKPEHRAAIMRAFCLIDIKDPLVKKSITKTIAKVLDVKERDVLMEASRVRSAQQIPKEEGYSESEQKVAMELLRDPNLLQMFLNLCHVEYLGRDEILLLVKLATITRRFKRGIPVLIQGPSSGGKSELVKTVLKTMDHRDKVEYMMTSSKFLAYQTQPIDHKVVVFYELQGMEAAAPMIRTAMTEGDIRTGTVMKNEQGVIGAVELETDTTGTVFITTMASGKVDHELRTRLFCVEITHDAELSKEIFRAKARSLSKTNQLLKTAQTGAEQVNLLILKEKTQAAQLLTENRRKNYFRIFQCADSLVKPLEVTVPYAEKIAETFPSHDPKFHRDIDKVFNLIRASALLHQYQRNRDEAGAIIAVRDDYEVVYSLRYLVSDSVSVVSDNEIKFLEVAQSLVGGYGEDTKYPTTKQVMDMLGVSPSTIRRYKAETAAAGLLEIMGKGMGALLKVLEIPLKQHPLPDPDVLFEESCSPDSPFNRSPLIEVSNQKDHVDSQDDFSSNFTEQLSSTSFSIADKGDKLLTAQLSDAEHLTNAASAEAVHSDSSNAGAQPKFPTDEPAPRDDNSNIHIPMPDEPGYGDCGYWVVRDCKSGEEIHLDKRHAIDRLIKCEVAFVAYTE